MNAEVILLHVISDPVYYASTAYSPIMGLTDSMGSLGLVQLDSIEGLKKASQLFLDKTKLHLGDDSIKTLVAEGDFAGSILSAAKQIHADVIVIGSHSRKWLENIVMGSVTEQVLRHTLIPLFIVPTKNHG
jgi:nucleotide-binding universal stress UspA family protein